MLQKIIFDYVNSQIEEKEKNAFYCTDNEKCRRQLFYELKHLKTSNFDSYESKRRMDTGTRIESGIVDVMSKLGILNETQVRVDVPFTAKYPIHGYVDALITIEDRKYLVEIKSYYGYWQAKEIKENGPKSSYVKQLGLYLFFLQDVIKDLDSGFIYMEDRSDSTTHCFQVKIEGSHIICDGKNYGHVDGILKRWKDVDYCLEKDIIPVPDFQYKHPIEKLSDKDKKALVKSNFAYVEGDWQCKYCSYKDFCIEKQGIGLGYTDEEKGLIRGSK